MTGRTYVLIFFFWSVLAIVTPTLVLLSENSKLPSMDIELTDEKNGGFLSRKVVLGLTRKYTILKVLAEEENAARTIQTTVTAPVPSPAPTPVVAVREFIASARKVILKTWNMT